MRIMPASFCYRGGIGDKVVPSFVPHARRDSIEVRWLVVVEVEPNRNSTFIALRLRLLKPTTLSQG
jgi:hypothetical protein